MSNTRIDQEAVLEWYSGKAQAAVRDHVLPTLRSAAALGCWPKGEARKVKALLNKQSPAIRWAVENEGILKRLRFEATSVGVITGYYLAHAMQFGLVGLAPANAKNGTRRTVASTMPRRPCTTWGLLVSNTCASTTCSWFTDSTHRSAARQNGRLLGCYEIFHITTGHTI